MKRLPFILKLLLTSSLAAHADVRFDGTLNPSNAPNGLTLSGQTVEIKADFGKQVGSNLFHSFDQFNVNVGQTLTFSPTGSIGAIANIFSRVTGNSLSQIDGVLRSTIPNADLYLFNPNGVVFGTQGTLDLRGSMHISTANFIRFNDNSVFSSHPAANEILTVAEPSAFGFLDKPADISVQTASLKKGDPELKLTPGKSLSFTGGNLTFKDPNVIVYNGTLRLISSKVAGEIPVSANETADIVTSNTGGDIHLTDSTIAAWTVDGNDLSPGSILIQGGRLLIDSSAITSSSFSTKSGGNIRLIADQIIMKKLPEFEYLSKVQSNGYFEGQGGEISVNTNLLDMSDQSLILAEVNQLKTIERQHGDGGSITITSPVIKLTTKSEISTSSRTAANGGNVVIRSSQINLDNANIASVNSGSGEAGVVKIETDSLEVKNSGAISVETALGNAGDIHINAKNLIYFLDSELTTSAAAGNGNGGNIDIDPIFVVLNNSKIIANALEGNGGNINITSDFFLQSTDSIVRASSEFGLQGTISINSANSNIAGSIAVLSSKFIDSSALIQEGCNRKKNSSSFLVLSKSLVRISPDNSMNYLPTSLQDCSS
jgi:filamentous hemagglutinin family protein